MVNCTSNMLDNIFRIYMYIIHAGNTIEDDNRLYEIELDAILKNFQNYDKKP